MKTRLTVKNPQLQRGVALVMVMIIILTLSVVVGGFAYAMKVEMRLARNSDYDNDMHWLGRSGVEMARYLVTVKCQNQQNIDALNQQWAGGVGNCPADSVPQVPHSFQLRCNGGIGNVDYTITDMSRKFDINMVLNPQFPQNITILQNALNKMGVTDTQLAQTITDSLQDWVGPRGDHARLSGAKDDFYQSQIPPYYCKCGWIDDMNELLLVKGIKDHPEIFWGSNSTNHTTSAYELKAQNSPFLRDREQPSYPFGLNDIFCAGGQKLNVNTAQQNVLEMIPGFDEQVAQEAIRRRAGPDGVDGNEDDQPFNNPGEAVSTGVGGPTAPIPNSVLQTVLDTHSWQFEVKVHCDINGYSKEYTAIIRRTPNKPNDLQILQFWWK